MLSEPAVSIPEIVRTNTLSLSILRMFKAETKAIISGNPSGTAITMMVTANITACKMSIIISDEA